MRKLTVLLIVAFTLLKCHPKNEKVEFVSLQKEEIDNIVEAVILQDSLKTNSILFCNQLKKTTIEIPVKRKDGLEFPPVPGNIYIKSLLNDKVNGEFFFTSKDSLSMLAQNSNPERIKIGSKVIDNLKSTTYEKEMLKRKNGKPSNFYEMSIPIFSLDKQKAYIELDHSCGSLCGNGKAYYLKKIKGKWKVIEKWETWIS